MLRGNSFSIKKPENQIKRARNLYKAGNTCARVYGGGGEKERGASSLEIREKLWQHSEQLRSQSKILKSVCERLGNIFWPRNLSPTTF